MNTQTLRKDTVGTQNIPAGIHTSGETLLPDYSFNPYIISSKSDDKRKPRPSNGKASDSNDWKFSLRGLAQLKRASKKRIDENFHDQSSMYLYAIPR